PLPQGDARGLGLQEGRDREGAAGGHERAVRLQPLERRLREGGGPGLRPPFASLFPSRPRGKASVSTRRASTPSSPTTARRCAEIVRPVPTSTWTSVPRPPPAPTAARPR